MSFKKAYCSVSVAPVRAEQKDASEMVTQLLFGELVTIEQINLPWCKITTFSDNYSGFCDIKHLRFLSEKESNRWMDGLSFQHEMMRKLETPWGKQIIFRGSFIPFEHTKQFNIGNDYFTFQDEFETLRRKSAFELAEEYLNTPYLWGGKTPFGIDCSGLTQTVFRLVEMNIPRDASQQAEYGQLISFIDMEKDDLIFFANKEGKIIHVGIADGKGFIIHASGMVRKDLLTESGIIHSETGEQTHSLHSVKRL